MTPTNEHETPQPKYSYCPVHGDLLAGVRSARCAEATPGHENETNLTEWGRISRTDFARGLSEIPVHNLSDIEKWRERGYVIVTRKVTDWIEAN